MCRVVHLSHACNNQDKIELYCNTVVETDDIQSIQHTCYFSLLVDESNDVCNAKNLLIYCQYLDPVRKKVESFIKLLPLKECDA